MFYNIQCSAQGTKQCNISISATVMPQGANHYSMTESSKYTTSIQCTIIVISMQQFTMWFQCAAKGNHNNCVTKGVLFLQVTVYVAYSDFKFNINTLRKGDANLRFLHYNCARRMTQICVFNTCLFSLHNTLNYAIHGACLRMVLLMDVYRNLTSLWIKPRERAFKQFKSPVPNVLNLLSIIESFKCL